MATAHTHGSGLATALPLPKHSCTSRDLAATSTHTPVSLAAHGHGWTAHPLRQCREDRIGGRMAALLGIAWTSDEHQRLALPTFTCPTTKHLDEP